MNAILKLRFRRGRRRQWARAVGFAKGAGEQFEKDFLGRLGKFRLIWKFVLVWTLLFALAAGGLTAQLVGLEK